MSCFFLKDPTKSLRGFLKNKNKNFSSGLVWFGSVQNGSIMVQEPLIN